MSLASSATSGAAEQGMFDPRWVLQWLLFGLKIPRVASVFVWRNVGQLFDLLYLFLIFFLFFCLLLMGVSILRR